jgi:hypothetical protein
VLFTLWVPLLAQLVLPVALLVWLTRRRPESRVPTVMGWVLAALYVLAIGMAGLWLALPWYLPFLYGVFLIATVHRALRGSAGEPLWPRTRRGIALLALLAVATAVMGILTLRALQSRSGPETSFELHFPLTDGTYLVANGGGSELINAHLRTLKEARLRRYQGQSYGVDLVKLGPLGLRARGVVPGDPESYAIFGDLVVAPCAGTVIRAEDGHPDLRPPAADRRHLAGNHVLLQCDTAWVLLGHLQRGSLRVVTGRPVKTGEALGRVGNSGNTNEPHLHIHAQRPGTPDEPLSGEPLEVRFEGWYPARNARLTVGPPRTLAPRE